MKAFMTSQTFETTSGQETHSWQWVLGVSPTGIQKKRLSHRDRTGNRIYSSTGTQKSSIRMAAVMRRMVCIFMCLSVSQVNGAFISNELNRTLQNLMQHYKISNQDLFNQKPVFPREPLKGNVELKMVYMYGVLEEYEKLLGHMLKQLPTPSPQLATSRTRAETSGPRTASLAASDEIRSNLMTVLTMMQELKKTNYKEQAALLEQLRKLEDIEVGNFKVQSKALLELTWIYEEASSLADAKRRRRRRRRQTKTKSHLPA